MGKTTYKCTMCEQALDSSSFNEESKEYLACIECYEPIRRDKFIQWAEKELDRLKNDGNNKSIMKDKNTIECIKNMNNTVNQIRVKLDRFISETRKQLNAILEKYNLNNNDSKARLLNYEDQSINLYEALELYYSLDDSEFKEIMVETFNLTHKGQFKSWNKKIDVWSNKYPDIVNRKINGIKNKLKQARKDPVKSREMKERYYSEKMISFRFPTIRKMLNTRGHLNVSDSCIMQSLKAYYKMSNDEIMNDLIAHKNDHPDNDINIEMEYEQKEPSKTDYLGSYTNPIVMNQKDILNREV